MIVTGFGHISSTMLRSVTVLYDFKCVKW